VMARVYSSAAACMASIGAQQAAVLASGTGVEGKSCGNESVRQEKTLMLDARAVLCLVCASVEEMFAPAGVDCVGGVGAVERAVGAARVLSALAAHEVVHVDGGSSVFSSLEALEPLRRLVLLIPVLCSQFSGDGAGGSAEAEAEVVEARAPGRLSEDSMRALLKPLRVLAARDGCCLLHLSRCLGGWRAWEAVIKATLALMRERAGGCWGLVGDVADLALALPPGACAEEAATGEDRVLAEIRQRALGEEVARYGALFVLALCVCVRACVCVCVLVDDRQCRARRCLTPRVLRLEYCAAGASKAGPTTSMA
jgi:hypothetical protein